MSAEPAYAGQDSTPSFNINNDETGGRSLLEIQRLGYYGRGPVMQSSSPEKEPSNLLLDVLLQIVMM